MRVLVVEDDPHLACVLGLYLAREGMTAERVADGLEAWRRFEAAPPKAVLLDLSLPGLDGLELCRRIRAASRVPIVMLTARDSEADELRGLGLGADDYVTKPFSPRLVMARLHSVLRRTHAAEAERVVRAGRVAIDLDARVVTVDGAPLQELRAKEFELLVTLAERPGKVFTKAEIQQALYGWDAFVGSRAVDQQVANLRAKLPEPALIRTVRGIGYGLVA